jgi:hypothetical protein
MSLVRRGGTKNPGTLTGSCSCQSGTGPRHTYEVSSEQASSMHAYELLVLGVIAACVLFDVLAACVPMNPHACIQEALNNILGKFARRHAAPVV